MTQPTLQTRKTDSLQLHPLKARLPRPDKTSPEYLAHRSSVESGGVRQPLLITQSGMVLDGEWRWEASKDLHFDTIPCLVRDDGEAALVIADGLLARKTMTRGAAVYFALPLLKEIIESANDRRLANLRTGRKTGEKPLILPNRSNSYSVTEMESLSDLHKRLGVTQKTFDQARALHELFHDPKCKELAKRFEDAGMRNDDLAALRLRQTALREEFEPRLGNGEMNLWNVSSAIAGRLTTAEQPKVTASQLDLFEMGVGTVIKRMIYWQDMAETTRRQAWDAMVKEAEDLAPEVLESSIEFFTEAARKLREIARAQKTANG